MIPVLVGVAAAASFAYLIARRQRKLRAAKQAKKLQYGCNCGSAGGYPVAAGAAKPHLPRPQPEQNEHTNAAQPAVAADISELARCAGDVPPNKDEGLASAAPGTMEQQAEVAVELPLEAAASAARGHDIQQTALALEILQQSAADIEAIPEGEPPREEFGGRIEDPPHSSPSEAGAPGIEEFLSDSSREAQAEQPEPTVAEIAVPDLPLEQATAEFPVQEISPPADELRAQNGAPDPDLSAEESVDSDLGAGANQNQEAVGVQISEQAQAELAETEPLPAEAGAFDTRAAERAAEPNFIEAREGETENDESRTVPLYQPPRQRVPRPPRVRPSRQERAGAARIEETLEIRVHLSFDRFHFCSISLLPERIIGIEDDIEARNGTRVVQLIAQEDWYQDLQFDEMGKTLRDGLELKAVLPGKKQVRWLLTRRQVLVLATHPRAHAYVSTSRLALGRSDVVLCVTEAASTVEALLSAGGCRDFIKFGESEGAPKGWTGFRNVVPTIPIALAEGSDPFYPLKPAPDLEIGFEGGVCLRNSAYLAGFAPQIKLYGQHAGGIRTFIDGKEAQVTADGVLEAEGFAAPGFHTIYCEGSSCSRSYSIEEPPENWEIWPAYPFRQADICGPIVTPKAERKEQLLAVPMSNPLLIGPVPGQVYRCPQRKSAVWKGYVPFDVAWALPERPLTSDKKTAQIIQFRSVPAVAAENPRRPTKAEILWSSAILEAARKGLPLLNAVESDAVLWRGYKKTARDIRRSSR